MFAKTIHLPAPSVARRLDRVAPESARGERAAQHGVSLIMVLLILVIASMLGVASMQISMMGERGARNDRDLQLAWQSAEAALIDAEIDLMGPNASSNSRTAAIQAGPVVPDSGCTSTGTWRGVCNPATVGSSKPTWLTVDFTTSSSAAVPLGTYTDRPYPHADDAAGANGKGVQPALAPRYLVEDVSSADASQIGNMVGSSYTSSPASGTKASAGRVYRVTAVGFGPRRDIQAAVQSVYRN